MIELHGIFCYNYCSKRSPKEDVTMKLYYKLTVSADVPHAVKVAFVHAFCLMEVSHGRKGVTFFGLPDDIIAACDLLNEEGYMAKKIWLRQS